MKGILIGWLLVPMLALAQDGGGQVQGVNGEPKRQVLKALPIGGDDDEVTAGNVVDANHALAAKSEPKPGPVDLVKPTTRPVLKALPATNDAVQPLSPTAGAGKPLTLPSPSKVPSPLSVKPVGVEAVKLQIFLDEACFGPGIIDGKPGQFTELAVQAWNEVHGYPSKDWVAVNTAARKAVQEPHAIAIVPDVSAQWVDVNLPNKYEDQVKFKRLSYRSVAEFMAERYHCDIPYLIELNGAARVNGLKVKDTLVVPNVQPFLIEKLTEIRYEAQDELSQRHVVVNTKTNQLRIYRGGAKALVLTEGQEAVVPEDKPNDNLVAAFPITPGKPQFIKLGTWELKNMVQLPWWRYDKQLLEKGVRSNNAMNLPSGPNSPVGVIWNGTSRPGIGLHGTYSPETIGRARSAGCIRLTNWDAIRLPTLIRPGATVEIR